MKDDKNQTTRENLHQRLAGCRWSMERLAYVDKDGKVVATRREIAAMWHK